jgi:phage terminase large subunit-like protein
VAGHVDAAGKYAADVREGAIPACRRVIAACLRYEQDRARETEADWPYRFDAKAAEKVCAFIEYLPHTKGKWAAERKRLILSPWQSFIYVNVFGFLRKSDGLRRFRDALCVVPRKNGKSLMSAGTGLYMLTADNEHGAEVYAGATTEKQAWEVFRPAKQMAQGTPALLDHYGVDVNASNIHILGNGSRFEPLIGKPGDGASPSCAIIDEYHEHADSAQFDTMLTGMGARDQPLMWVITTAGDNVAGPCYDKLLTGRAILDGTMKDEEKFFIEYTIDDDDWTSETAIRKANPNLDVSVSLEFLLARQREAVNNTREQGRFKTKHLDLWVQSRNAYFNMQKWASCRNPGLRMEDFAGRRAWLGLDLASEIDIAALEVVIEDGDGFVRFGRSYAPEDTVEDPKNKHYQGWMGDGRLTVTEGAMIDFERIEEDIVKIAALFRNAEVAFDPFQATFLVTRLMARGIECVKYPQQVATMSPAMKRLDALITDGKIRHDCDERDPMTWMLSNVVARVDAKDNVYPRKERPENKIDNPVALMMAIGRAVLDDNASPYSDGRGLMVL